MMTNQDLAVNLKGVSKKYKLFRNKTDRMKEALHPFKKSFHQEFFALRDVDLQVRRGEILGIVGMNGSGKSTLLKIISGIIPPTSGEVNVSGNVVPLLELGAGFNPEFTGMENIYFYNSILGYSRKQTQKIVDNIIDFAEIGDFIHQPLKTYSSGMKARLSFAVSVNIQPDILILDEVLSVGDELFKRKSYAKIEEFFNAGKTILFVSHSAQSVNQLCSRAVMLVDGRLVLEGPAKFITMNYQKLIFSRPEQKKQLLQEFKTLIPREDSDDLHIISPQYQEMTEEVFSGNDTYEIKPFLVKNFSPKSTVVTRNVELVLSPIRIETLEGDEVNHLVAGRDYNISYTLSFLENIGHISLGISFTTEKGISVSWRFFPTVEKYFQKFYRNGDSVHVKWKFSCNLMPDNYFIGLVVRRSGEEGGEVAYRASDIQVFKVISEKLVSRGGIYDPDFSITLT